MREDTIAVIRGIAARCYAVEFPSDVPLSERVLWPSMDAEQAGMEDARFVRFVDDDGSVTYYATYTAYSGSHISQQLLETTDFRSFTSVPLVGRAAANKGLALFPRRIKRSLRRHVAIGPRDELRRLRRSSVGLDRLRRPASSRPRRGRRCSSETAVHQSKPTRAGWC